jgi:hypothetical protein
LFAVRAAGVGEQPIYVIGGEQLDQGFLSTLDIPAGTRVLLYQNLEANWNPKSLLDLNGSASGADKFAPLVEQVRRSGQEAQSTIRWSADSADAENFHALPLAGRTSRCWEFFPVGSSRRPLIACRDRLCQPRCWSEALAFWSQCWPVCGLRRGSRAR